MIARDWQRVANVETGEQETPPGEKRRKWRKSEFRWRKRFYSLEAFIYQLSGCHQGTILAPVAAWLRLPSSGCSRPLDILDRLATSVSQRGRVLLPWREQVPLPHAGVAAITAPGQDRVLASMADGASALHPRSDSRDQSCSILRACSER